MFRVGSVMLSLEKIHLDLCWVVYYSQKALLDTNIYQNPQPDSFQKSLEQYDYLFDPKVISFLSNYINNNENDISLAQSLKFILTEYGGILENYKIMINFYEIRKKMRLRVLSYDLNTRLSVLEAFQLSFNSDLDRYIRFHLYDAYSGFYLKKNHLLVQILTIYKKRAKTLGFSTIYDMLQDAMFYNLQNLETHIIDYLEKTKEQFQEELNFHLEDRSGVNIKHAHVTDLRRSFDPKHLPTFEETEKLEIFKMLDQNLEMNTFKEKIKIREKKESIYPFALNIIKPNTQKNKLYLIYNKNSGIFDWRLFFREIGHLFQFRNISSAIPRINQMSGDLTTSEYIARIFENLMLNQDFLKNNFKQNSISLRNASFQYEIEKRNVLIKSLHQMNLFRAEKYSEYTIKEIKRKFEEIFYEYFGFYREGYDFISQIDFKLTSIFSKSYSYLLMDQNYHQFQSDYTKNWWKNPKFGNYLKKEIFELGFQNWNENLVV